MRIAAAATLSLSHRRAVAQHVARIVTVAEKACKGTADDPQHVQHVVLEVGPSPAAHPRVSLDPPPEGSKSKPRTLHTEPAAAEEVADALAAVLVTKEKDNLTVITVCGTSGGSAARVFARRTVRPSGAQDWVCDAEAAAT